MMEVRESRVCMGADAATQIIQKSSVRQNRTRQAKSLERPPDGVKHIRLHFGADHVTRVEAAKLLAFLLEGDFQVEYRDPLGRTFLFAVPPSQRWLVDRIDVDPIDGPSTRGCERCPELQPAAIELVPTNERLFSIATRSTASSSFSLGEAKWPSYLSEELVLFHGDFIRERHTPQGEVALYLNEQLALFHGNFLRERHTPQGVMPLAVRTPQSEPRRLHELFSMPRDLLHRILRRLSSRSVAALSMTCRYAYHTCRQLHLLRAAEVVEAITEKITAHMSLQRLDQPMYSQFRMWIAVTACALCIRRLQMSGWLARQVLVRVNHYSLTLTPDQPHYREMYLITTSQDVAISTERRHCRLLPTRLTISQWQNLPLLRGLVSHPPKVVHCELFPVYEGIRTSWPPPLMRDVEILSFWGVMPCYTHDRGHVNCDDYDRCLRSLRYITPKLRELTVRRPRGRWAERRQCFHTLSWVRYCHGHFLESEDTINSLFRLLPRLQLVRVETTLPVQDTEYRVTYKMITYRRQLET